MLFSNTVLQFLPLFFKTTVSKSRAVLEILHRFLCFRNVGLECDCSVEAFLCNRQMITWCCDVRWSGEKDQVQVIDDGFFVIGNCIVGQSFIL